MTTPQLMATVLVALLPSVACSRADTRADAQRASVEVKAAADRAREGLEDGWLTTKVQAQFFADDDVKARYIDVTTRDGVVTLSGFVESQNVREQAVQMAKNTDGVSRVDDRLMIGQAPQAPEPPAGAVPTAGNIEHRIESTAERAAARFDDARISTSIQAKFFLDSSVKARDIDVDTRGGVVTLRGQVASEDERARALLLARSTDGVTRVEDVLTVSAVAVAK